LFESKGAPPGDPDDLLFYVSRSEAVPAAYPLSAASQWTPCDPGPSPKADHDLVCLPAAYVDRGTAALRRIAFESDAPPDLGRTHDGLAVGHRGKIGFKAMFDAAADEASVHLFVRSAFRSYTNQLVTFHGWVAYERNLGRYYADALRKAGTYSAREGHSEHQLGTTADLTFRTSQGTMFEGWDAQAMSESEAFRWVRSNAHRFGIALTYPREKTQVTQYRWEPWHYRFVGVEPADTMARCNLSTEEYLRARFDLPPAEPYPDAPLLDAKPPHRSTTAAR
jgi:hypothetical protein